MTTIDDGSAAQTTAYRRRAPVVTPNWLPLAVGLALVPALVALQHLWVAQLILIPLLLTLPGVLLLRALRVPSVVIAATPVYIPIASIVVLLASGLAVNFVGPMLGVEQPLRSVSLLVGLELAGLLLLLGSLRVPPEVSLQWTTLINRSTIFFPLILPVLAAYGALRLNHGASSVPAVVAACLVGAALIIMIVSAPRLDDLWLMGIIYATGLALLWSTSLRSEYVYGYDIATEYRKAQDTINNGAWSAYHVNDAYGALLSITTFPAQLHELAGVSTVVLFKVLYPAIFALLPVAVFALSRHILTARWAAIAAALIIVQRNFGQQLPGLARQEIALLIFVGLIALVLEKQLARYQQWTLITLFGLSVVVSHYSTTYLGIGFLLIALFVALCARHRRPVRDQLETLLASMLVLLVGAAVWFGAVTGSASNVTDFAQKISADGLSVLPNRTPGESLADTFFTGNAAEPISASQYEKDIANQYSRLQPYVQPLAAADDPRYRLADASVGPSESPIDSLLSGLAVVAQQLMFVLAAVGAALLTLGRHRSSVERVIGVLSIAGLGALVLLKLSGTVATTYNQDRALLQVLIVLTVAVGWVLQRACGANLRRELGLGIAAATAVILLFVNATGLVTTTMGTGAAVNLANNGEDYERFYIKPPELMAAQWLGTAAPAESLVYADRYGQLRYLLATGRIDGLLQDVTPRTLDQHAWVYASATNLDHGRARSMIDGKSVLYSFPIEYLEHQYDKVYTNGTSAVFHR